MVREGKNSERSQFFRNEVPVLADPDVGFGRKGNAMPPQHLGEDVDVRRYPRPRITIAPGWDPVLTERQRTIVQRRRRVRVSRSWGRMLHIMRGADMTMKEFVGTLSNEELARGQLKGRNGGFSGRPSNWVPREFHQACLRELLKRGKQLWMENYVEAIKAMTDIAAGRGPGKHATPAERIRAAQFVVERLEGKVPDKLEVSTDQPWQAAIKAIVADVSPEQIAKARRVNLFGEDDVIDADVVEEPEPDPEPAPRPVRRIPAKSTVARSRRSR